MKKENTPGTPETSSSFDPPSVIINNEGMFGSRGPRQVPLNTTDVNPAQELQWEETKKRVPSAHAPERLARMVKTVATAACIIHGLPMLWWNVIWPFAVTHGWWGMIGANALLLCLVIVVAYMKDYVSEIAPDFFPSGHKAQAALFILGALLAIL